MFFIEGFEKWCFVMGMLFCMSVCELKCFEILGDIFYFVYKFYVIIW